MSLKRDMEEMGSSAVDMEPEKSIKKSKDGREERRGIF